jgi:hypothetical protein
MAEVAAFVLSMARRRSGAKSSRSMRRERLRHQTIPELLARLRAAQRKTRPEG